MSRRHRTAQIAVLLLVLLLVSSYPSKAQPGARDGTFVAAPDGAVWVVLGGTRHRIEAGQIAVGELGGLTEGASIQTVDALLALLQESPAPMHVSPELAPGGSVPTGAVAGLVGQAPTICQGSTPFTVKVVEIEAEKAIGTGAGTSFDGRHWVLVVVTATHPGQSRESLYEATRLRDERGRTWDDIAGTASAGHIGYEDLAGQRGAQVATNNQPPGVETRFLLVYSVAEDAKQLELISRTSGC